MTTFDSTKTSLKEILRQIKDGKVQLPEFQRGWVWDDEHVRSLLVSVARSFPVGAVMLLETGGNVRFQARPIENLEFSGPIPQPERLILDGQQRLTSLTQVLMLDKPVQTYDDKRNSISRYYYMDINRAMADDSLEDVFIAVDEERTVKGNFGRDIKLDLSTREKECKEFFFPCTQILDSSEWEYSLQSHAPEKFLEFLQFRRKCVDPFREYQLPVISLSKSTSKEAVCLVFEKVNTGGVPLSVFELITASFAAESDSFNLRDNWFGNKKEKIEGRAERLKREPVLETVEPTDFLQVVSLLHTWEKRQNDLAAGKTGKTAAAVSAKRASVLDLSLADYERWADKVEQGYLLAAKFLKRHCFFASWDLPYRTQLVPLAAVLTRLELRWLEPLIFDKLSRWYWCGVFGELYGGAVETRIANDLEELLAWIDQNGPEPRTIYEAAFQPGRLLTLRTRNSAAYKGLNTLILGTGARDFFWKGTVQELDHEGITLDIHHIFPRAWCDVEGIKPSVYNSIINKTPISYKANRMIGGAAPSDYLAALQNHQQVGLTAGGMDDILISHKIDPATLRGDDFEGFFARRRESLLTLIEQVMGKAIDRGQNATGFEDGSELDVAA